VFLIGDCEDSSVAFITCVHVLVPKDYKYGYELFGLVKDTDGNILGGHGWSVSKGLPDDQYRLYESTLDVPPAEYPIVKDPFKPFQLGDVVYEPEWIFNKYEFHTVSGVSSPSKRSQKEKETEQKYRAIAEAWHIKPKPLIQMERSKVRKVRRLIGKVLRR